MKTKRFFFTLITVFCTVFIAFSQQDKKAKDLLDKSLAVFSNAGGIKASFAFTAKQPNEKSSESFNGTIYMKENKFRLETPEFQAWFNGVNQWTYLKDNNEVNLTKPDADEVQQMNPSAVLSIYKKGFNCKYAGEKTVNGKKIDEIVLTPQKKNDWKKVVVQLDKTTTLPVRIQLQYANGMLNDIVISAYQMKQSFSDSLFSFDSQKYPGVEVIDLQ
ncbi:MAG: outer-membrane lipoprotein carrier protein LolA [Bacteroidales bacterium]|jgi:outer membrane lipoprotein-sorting protein|nr:outer-membrane lipoprotein carrier protein LolA [Bacteroidales bacterium]